jgi:hypothetical protein
MGEFPSFAPVVTLENGINPEILVKAQKPFAVGRFHIARSPSSTVATPPPVKRSLRD